MNFRQAEKHCRFGGKLRGAVRREQTRDLWQYRTIIAVQLRRQFSATYHISLIAQVTFCAELVFRQIVQ